MGNLIEVEIENKSYIQLQDLEQSSKGILNLTTLVDNQPGVIIKVFLNKGGNRIPLKEFEVRHISPKASGLPRFELGSSYIKKRLYLELKVDGRKTDSAEIRLAPYLRNKYLPFFIIIGTIAALLLIMGGKWLVTNVITTTSDVVKSTPESTGYTQKITPSETDRTSVETPPVEKTMPEQSDEKQTNEEIDLPASTTVPIEKTEKPTPLSTAEAPAETQTAGKAIVPEHTVYFSPNNTSIQKDAVMILKKLAVELINNADAVVEISGHCAMSGTKAGREELSRERAYNIVTYLKQEGWTPEIEPVVRWFGGTQPVTTESEEIYRNRRVEITVNIP